ncbi:MAG: ABC transporter permease [Pirellulales bacterium]|nr:ABC transporter permease [Pirellulales bacterium]
MTGKVDKNRKTPQPDPAIRPMTVVAQEGDILQTGAAAIPDTRPSEAYLDIVWKQFKKNRHALVALWAFLPLVLLAVFAPVIASNQPFVYFDREGALFPWFRALFNPAEPVDFAFNMALIAFLPWLLTALAMNRGWKRRGRNGRERVLRAAGLYVLLTAATVAVFAPDTIRPSNRYAARTFSEEEFHSDQTEWGVYPPIPFGPTEQDIDSTFQPPLYAKSPEKAHDVHDTLPHVLGTDNAGRDVLVQMIYGTRIALTIGFIAVGLYISIGIVLGAIAGYFGGYVDIIISRIIEVILLFPAFFLILTLVGLLGPSIYIIMVVIGLTGWPTIARLIRGEVLKQRAIDYVAAARVLGASHLRVIFRHILPNAISPALVAAPFGIAGAIVTEAGLSLLGFGVRPPTPTWGTLLRLGNANYHYWWLVVIPSLAIFLAVTIFNLVGSGLRDAMDPRLRR